MHRLRGLWCALGCSSSSWSRSSSSGCGCAMRQLFLRLFFIAVIFLIRRRCISTTRRPLSSWSGRVLLRRQRVLKPRGRRFRFSSPHARCAHFSLLFLYIHSFIPISLLSYPTSYTYFTHPYFEYLRARTQCVLLHLNIFL
ncbi:hypothetical protein B0H14DRAFT_1293138 [Mycena olivaceomarginata]|nr:hypothetical protein B0H14DRAFT_1293138 [Mycena olivaceomarginata]